MDRRHLFFWSKKKNIIIISSRRAAFLRISCSLRNPVKKKKNQKKTKKKTKNKLTVGRGHRRRFASVRRRFTDPDAGDVDRYSRKRRKEPLPSIDGCFAVESRSAVNRVKIGASSETEPPKRNRLPPPPQQQQQQQQQPKQPKKNRETLGPVSMNAPKKPKFGGNRTLKNATAVAAFCLRCE